MQNYKYKIKYRALEGAPEKEGFPGGSVSKESTPSAGDPGSRPWVRKIPLEQEMVIHSCIPAWEIPWPEETGRLQGRNWTQLRD